MSKTYFEQSDAIAEVLEVLEDSYTGYLCDLQDEVFNTDYYIIGTHEATEALEQFGTFGAINVVKSYEECNFGKVYTDFSNPEKVANMLWYIIGLDVTNALGEEFPDLLEVNINKDNNPEILEFLRSNL